MFENLERKLPAQSATLSLSLSLSWKRVRGWVMFAVACFTSPCCTPLLVPLLLSLLAATPFAAWASLHLGWVYGAFTGISIISLLLGWRWRNQHKAQENHGK